MLLQEILQLKVGDVRGKKELKIQLGSRSVHRHFHMSPELIRTIEAYTDGRGNDEWLIRGQTNGGMPLSREQAYRALRNAGRSIGLEAIGAQTMRKTFAWNYYQTTGDISYLQALLNHASPTITYRYIGEKPGMEKVMLKRTPAENERSRYRIFKDGSGRKRLQAIRDAMDTLEADMADPSRNDAYFGRLELLLTGIEELLDQFRVETARGESEDE